MNVFQEIGGAIAGVKAYPGFLRNRKIKVFGYALLVVTLAFIVGNIRSVITAEIFIAGLGVQIQANVPDFELEDGKFYMETSFELDEEDMYIYLDSELPIVFSATEDEWRQIFRESGYSNVIIVDADGVLVLGNGQLQMSPWPKGISFSRDKLIASIPFFSLLVLIVFAFLYVWKIASYFFSALFVALIAMAISASMQHRLTFGKFYLLSLYGKTLMLFVSAVLNLIGLATLLRLGFILPFISLAVAIVYVYQAVSLIQRQKVMGQNFGPGPSPYMKN